MTNRLTEYREFQANAADSQEFQGHCPNDQYSSSEFQSIC